MHNKLLPVILLALLLLAGCGSEEKEQNDVTVPADNHKVTVVDIEQANSYTYLLVDENGTEHWIAISKNENIEEGSTLYYKDAMEMKDFRSEDLDRTFGSIFFVQNISRNPIASGTGMKSPHQNIKPEADESIDVEPADGGISIAELFENSESYSGKTVIVRGQVVKVNRQIMNRNWYHIQDGTGDGENYDLTVTSNDNAQMGEVVTFEGKVTLNKDFGSGYKYDIIIEEAKRI